MNKSYLVAIFLSLAIIGWMVAGRFASSSVVEAASQSASTESVTNHTLVEVRPQAARGVMRHIVAQGQVEPNRAVTIRAETAGRIIDVVTKEGQAVRTNDVLVRLEMNDRQAQLKKAEALLRERRRAYEAAKKLGEKGYQAHLRIDETFSGLETAQAELEEIRMEISKTSIVSPFDGVLETRRVEIGDYVVSNGEIATIVDNNPLVATVQIAQQDVDRLELGGVAVVSFATGQRRDGVTRFIAPRAEEATRTFRVEIEVPNPDGQIRSGVSAEVEIPVGTVDAHFISPALLTLDEEGQIGVKTIDERNVVAFHRVAIVIAEASGIWVSGLPAEARIISVGQGFVRAGETVRVAPTPGASAISGTTPEPMLVSSGPANQIEKTR